MAEKKTHRRATARRVDRGDAVVSDGMIGRLVDRACDNPAMTGGLFVMALTASAIVSNALFLQNVRHPEPLFSTRSPLVVDRYAPVPPPVIPLPPRRDGQTGSIAPPLPRAAPATIVAPTKPTGQALLRDIQALLARKGLYLGAVDGVYGTLSRSAISAYQKAEGLRVSGEPSDALLDHLETSAVAVPPTPAPAPVAAVQSQPADPTPSIAEQAVATGERLRYQRVQAALNRIGYGPVSVDGNASEGTSNAIRRFELDNGLPISGTADDAVIDRLVAIGALPAT